MSTRALIARKTGQDSWEAVYHHWDGYPAGLGAMLFELWNGHFEKDTSKMLNALLSHRAGWSTIIGDWSKEPGYTITPEGLRNRPPQCYCHGEHSEPMGPLYTNDDVSFGGAEYCYVIDPETRTMEILERRYSDGEWEGMRATQFFGVDASEVAGAYWALLGTVDLDGEAPDWRKMEGPGE